MNTSILFAPPRLLIRSSAHHEFTLLAQDEFESAVSCRPVRLCKWNRRIRRDAQTPRVVEHKEWYIKCSEFRFNMPTSLDFSRFTKLASDVQILYAPIHCGMGSL